MNVQPYPFFEGRAADALAFYCKALGRTFWSPRFGMLTDRFGFGWFVTVPQEAA